MTYHAVLFDLGQTLLEYPGASHEFWREFLERRLADMRPLFAKMGAGVGCDERAFVERTMDIMWPQRQINMDGRSWHFRDRVRAVLLDCGCETFPDGEVERLTDVFYQPISEGTRRYAETLDVLDELRSSGVPLAIISNAPWDVPGRLLLGDMERWGIADHFDAMVMSGDVPWRKPNPEFMWAAAKALAVEPSNCLVVGDSLKADIAGAKAAGMGSVWVNRDGAVMSEGDPRPNDVVGNLRAVLALVSP